MIRSLKKDNGYICDAELEALLKSALPQDLSSLKKVLLMVPDYTRLHSDSGRIASALYAMLSPSCEVDLLECLGTHVPMSPEEISEMYPGVPLERFIEHNWRTDCVQIGTVPGDFVKDVSEGISDEDIPVEIDRRVVSGEYDLVLSIGQVVPHEVVGMANQAKNLFVGAGGSRFINAIHLIGAFYGLERMMGKDLTPVRRILDYALDNFMGDVPLDFILTVTEGLGKLRGVYIGREREAFEMAVAQAQQVNMTALDAPLKKCVVYLDPGEFKSTWLGGKAVYRTRMAMADGGELIILAPGIERFGEDPENDRIIRKYGYCGRENVIRLFGENADLRDNQSAAAHLIHVSTDGRFNVTLCAEKLSREEVEKAGFKYIPYREAAEKYGNGRLKPGYNELENETVYYIPNPALGLWTIK